MFTRTALLIATGTLAYVMAYASSVRQPQAPLELHSIAELALHRLESPPSDPSNRWSDDSAAAALGQRLFFDVRLSANGTVSCASCHDPERNFQDGVALARGIGTTDRRTMPLAGAAHSRHFFWDGRKDSLWAQALGPLESAVEHGSNRAHYAHVIAIHYRDEFERVFGALPDLKDVPMHAGPVSDPNARAAWEAMTQEQRDRVTAVFVNIGKAIAAYERRIEFTSSRFDRFVAEWERTGAMPTDILNRQERAGLALFVGKAQCVQCHNGPLFTNDEFHNTGVPQRRGLPRDRGRYIAVEALQNDEFNCRSRWSDAEASQCQELEFLAPASIAQERAFKVPSLRNVADRAPYMHAGQFETLDEVLNHYNRAPAARYGTSELTALRLSRAELDELTAFLGTLSSTVSSPIRFGVATSHDSTRLVETRP